MNEKEIIPLQPFYFLRHGETDWNLKGQLMGQTDIPLNLRGRQQVEEALRFLKSETFETVITSPLSRAYESARRIAEVLKKPLEVISDLQEIHHGCYTGQIKKEPFDFIKDHVGKGSNGGETWLSFSTRVQKGFLTAISCPSPVLIVSHGGVYRVLEEWFGVDHLGLDNAVPIYHKPPLRSDLPWIRTPLF